MRNISLPDITPAAGPDESSIDLREYYYVLTRYKWSVLGLTTLITLLAALYVYSLPPVFRATSTLTIDSERPNVVSIEQVYGLPNPYYEYYQTQIEIIRSRDLSTRIVDKLKLTEQKKFNENTYLTHYRFDWKALLPESWRTTATAPLEETPPLQNRRDQLAGQVNSMLEVSLVPDSQLITISFDSYNPQLSAQLANALADIYIESGLEARLENTRKASTWITEQLKELKDKVDASEKALQDFYAREHLVDAKGVDSLAVKEMDSISEKLVEARRNSSEVGELYRQIMAMEGQPVEAYESIPAVLKDPQVHDARVLLANAQSKMSELAKRYGEKHPKMIAAKAEVASAKSNLQAQISNVVDSVKKEYSVAKAEESHLHGAMAATKQELASINKKSHELRTLEYEVQSNRQLYDMFLTRFKETTATDDLQTTNARIVDRALPPVGPYKPDRQRFILGALVASLILSVLLVFMIEKLDNTLSDSNQVENRLFMPVLGILPKLSIWSRKDAQSMRYYTDKKHSSFSENIRTIRTSILLTDIDVPRKIVLVTSSVPAEGKSIVAVNLALALGQMGKTLLIDADMRKPTIAKVFGMDSKTAGLSQFIAGTHELKHCEHYYEEEKIHVMPSGQIPSNPLELLSSHRFEKGLQMLKDAYNYIVIDSAPTVPVSDAIVLSRHANATIYVVKANDTPYQLAKTGIKKLQQVQANIVGAVLNQVEPAKRPGRYGYGESDYYTYYGYGKA